MRKVGRQVAEVAEWTIWLVVRMRRARDHQVIHLVRPEIEDAAPVFLVELPMVGQAETAGLFRRQVHRCLDVAVDLRHGWRGRRTRPGTGGRGRGVTGDRGGGAGRRRLDAGEPVVASQALAGIRDLRTVGKIRRALLGKGKGWGYEKKW